MRVIVINHLSLDGVLQGPGNPDEDTRDGFRHGGWAAEAGADPVMGAAMGERMGADFRWLFGRRSYEGMLSHWNAAGGPFKDGLNATQKYVVAAPGTPLPWPHSTLVSGDVPAGIGDLRRQPGGNLVIMGSGRLIRTLLPLGLIDELLLMVHPVVLGSGHRLFGPDPQPHRLRLAHCSTTSTGVILSTYQPDGSAD